MAEKCSICDFPIEDVRIQDALAAAPATPDPDITTFYHLECALSDGSFITEAEVTEEDRLHGVYWIERL